MENMSALFDELMGDMAKFKQNSPEQMQAFHSLHETATKDGTLSHKNKELIALALGVASRCKWCIAFHVKNAFGAGASADEIREASWVAVLMGGGPALMYHQLVEKAIEDFKS